jgi:hypothetical protein
MMLPQTIVRQHLFLIAIEWHGRDRGESHIVVGLDPHLVVDACNRQFCANALEVRQLGNADQDDVWNA